MFMTYNTLVGQFEDGLKAAINLIHGKPVSITLNY